MLKHKLRKKLLNIRKLNNNNVARIPIFSFFNIIKKYKLNNKVIGGYYPVNYELDDLGFLKELEKKKITISLPVISKNFNMNFYVWSFNNILNINKYGIPEPEKNKLVYPDILIVPMVAFDKRLYRLGYGGGFYDRYIEKIDKIKKVTKIGLAFSYQKIKSVPVDQYDKKLDFVITEKEIIE